MNTVNIVEHVNELVLHNHHVKIKHIGSEMNIFYGSASVIIHDQLGYCKLCMWVVKPLMLIDDHKNQLFVASHPSFSIIPWIVHNF